MVRLLSAVLGACRTSQAAGEARTERQEWFATIEFDWMSQDLDWLEKAVRIVEKQIQEMNRKQRGKQQSEISLVQ